MENAPAMDSELLVAASHGQHKHLTRLIAREVQVAAAAASWRPTTTTTSVVDVASSPASIVVEIDGGGATTTTTTDAIIPILEGVTPDGDSALHVVAASGDAETYLESAKVIHGKAGHLLCSRNRGGRTPLHRAARAGNVEMISLLIRLAVSGDGGEGETTRVETIVRMTNGGGETVLHEAIRVDDTRAVGVLMSADPWLARHHLAAVPGRRAVPVWLGAGAPQERQPAVLFWTCWAKCVACGGSSEQRYAVAILLIQLLSIEHILEHPAIQGLGGKSNLV
ncbi:hypothetical protein HU200_028677 [Digitaria exilis]|uniref:Uncharacterized protein n=1 Tax=Digitaria exilis TaxID=1010633 RepID=A0A835BVW3_9POAL|nr:hypothetical protein HU200_028677 [Digitaria exilis]